MTLPDPFTSNAAMDVLMSQFDEFGRLRAAVVETHEIDLYAEEEKLSVALADRAGKLQQRINATPMTGARRALLLTTLRAIRLDKTAPTKLDRLQADLEGGNIFEKPHSIRDQFALALAALRQLREHPDMPTDQKTAIASMADHLTMISAPIITSSPA